MYNKGLYNKGLSKNGGNTTNL